MKTLLVSSTKLELLCVARTKRSNCNFEDSMKFGTIDYLIVIVVTIGTVAVIELMILMLDGV